tara:strand:- start:5170 stop:6306 length:1137 start_codon:yes stop_codon:yes gene_type:complete
MEHDHNYLKGDTVGKKASSDDPVDQAKEAVAEKSKEAAELEDRFTALSDRAQGLVVSDQGLRQLVGAMVASRQLYAMAIHDLDARLDSEKMPYTDISDEDRSPLKEIFISSAATQAAHPFEEGDLLSGFRDTVIPWMETVSAAHTAEEARALKEDYEASEAERRAKDVVLGLDLRPAEEEFLDRERSLVLVGWGPALAYLSGKIIANSLTNVLDFNQVLHLAKSPSKQGDHRLLEIGGKAWENCAKSNNSWNKLFATSYLEKLSAPLDLFIVSDLSATNVGNTFQHEASRGAEAQKRLRKWATIMGAAMIGCMPQETMKGIDLNTPTWEKLRMFTRLRAVDVKTRDDGDYDITVGRHVLHKVAKSEVDIFNPSDIITP